MPSIDALAAVCIAYVIGSLPTAYLVGKYIGDADLTEVGSKNIGASNAYSQLGSRWAGFVIIIDVLIKGSLPVFIVSDAVIGSVSYTHLTLPTNRRCRSRWSPYH